MVFCTYCGHSFSRDEHLERHILTHTNIKPFKCFTCHMSFARRDLLQRHYTVHGRNQDNQDGLASLLVPKTAGRTPIACTNCAKTKTKCDKKFPCSRCSSRNLKCILRPTRRAPRNPSQLHLLGKPQGLILNPASKEFGLSSMAPSSLSPLPHEVARLAAQDAMNAQMALPLISPPIYHNSAFSSNAPNETNIKSEMFQTADYHSEFSHHLMTSVSQAPMLSLPNMANSIAEDSQQQVCCQPLLISPLNTPFSVGSSAANATPPQLEYEDFVTAAATSTSSSVSSIRLDPTEPNAQRITSAINWYQLPFSTSPMLHPMQAQNISPRQQFLNIPLFKNDTFFSQDHFMSPDSTSMLPFTGPDPEIPTDLQFVSEYPHLHPFTAKTLEDHHVRQTRPPRDTPDIHLDGVFKMDHREGNMTDTPCIVQAQKGWNCFKSLHVLPPDRCPKTAKMHLGRLENTLKNHMHWALDNETVDPVTFAADQKGFLRVVPLNESSKDKLLAISQIFLHKALDIHQGFSHNGDRYDLESQTHSPSNTSSTGHETSPVLSSNFMLLPSSHILTEFLVAYANSVEPYFPMTPTAELNLNHLLSDSQISERASSLLALLMIAAGALSLPSLEARCLSAGLVEACRISLFNSVETNISLACDGTLLHAALILVSTAAWGGDKWHMNIAMGQRGIYTAMLRHSGALEAQRHERREENPHAMEETLPDSTQVWQEWLRHEKQNRLVYSWVMLDQELSLFYDCNPSFTTTELCIDMPSAENLWRSQSVDEWTNANEQRTLENSQSQSYSLKTLFKQFIDHSDFALEQIQLTTVQLRLLLYPLQAMTMQYQQLPTGEDAPHSLTSKAVQGDSLRASLNRWVQLADKCDSLFETSTSLLDARQSATRLLFHLVSINTVASIPEIERVARGEVQQPLLPLQKSMCIQNPAEALTHAGQILHIIRHMGRFSRPAWWAAAVYRSALVLWIYAHCCVADGTVDGAETMQAAPMQRQPSVAVAAPLETLAFSPPASPDYFPLPTNASALGPIVVIDNLGMSDLGLARFRASSEGVVCVSSAKTGEVVRLQAGSKSIKGCIELIDAGIANRFSDGIRYRLKRLMDVE